MSEQPKIIKQLNEHLDKQCIEVFPFGKHRDQLVIDVVRDDPNYIVWWHRAIEEHPIDPVILEEAQKNYRESPYKGCGVWKDSIGTWDHWQQDYDPDDPLNYHEHF